MRYDHGVTERAPTDAPNREPGTPRTRKRRRLLLVLTIGITFAIMLIAAVVAELVLRSSGDHLLDRVAEIRYRVEADAHGGIVPTPDWAGKQRIEGRWVELHSNNLGLRRRDATRAKQPGESRILCIGDSMVYGQGVGDDETFCALLEHDLRATGKSVSIGNAGIPSTGLPDQVATLRRFRKSFDPDVVVSCFYMGNDFIDHLEERQVIDGYFLSCRNLEFCLGSWRYRLAYNSYLAYEVESFLIADLPALALDEPWFRGDLLPEPPKESPARYQEGMFMDQVAPLDPHMERLWKQLEVLLRALRDQAAPLPFVLVIVPTSMHVIPGQYELFFKSPLPGLDAARHHKGESQRRLRELGKRLGVTVFDLTEPLAKDANAAANWLPIDRHLTARGHRVVADWLRPRLERLLDSVR